MTPKPPRTPNKWRQKNTEGGTGFIGGEHHHYYPGAPDPRVSVAASIDATAAGVVVGSPIDRWDPADLGVHDSITVQEETTLTPYLPRDHDTELRGRLKELKDVGAGPRLILVVGTSCAGKTRTLYEGVRHVLREWRLVAPSTDSNLARVLLDGVPAHTVVWLDELQDELTRTSHGVTSANAIYELLQSAEVGPILFAGTIWPTNHDALLARPAPEESSGGAGAISKLLKKAVLVEVPETFTDADLAAAQDSGDARLRKAYATASEVSHPERGRKITQVLAGGAQLVNRLHPPPDNPPVDNFSPAARAVLHAAGDLRRIGIPNPLPRWAIEGAACGYLQSVRTRPAHIWLTAALDESTQDAADDDAITGHRCLDVHAKGVPALTPHWTTRPDGQELEAYDLHDYLYQDHLNRHRATPTRPQLWDTLTSHPDHHDDGRIAHAALARSAEDRGLTRHAIALWRVATDEASSSSHEATSSHLASLGDIDALAQLRSNATGGNADQDRLAAALGTLAELGDELARDELWDRSAQGDLDAWLELRSLLIAEGGDKTALPPRPTAETSSVGGSAPRQLSLGRLRSPTRSRAGYAYDIGDVDRLLQLREWGSDTYIGRRLAALLIEANRLDQLSTAASTSRSAYNALAKHEELSRRSMNELRELARTDGSAARTLALFLLQNNEIDELALLAPESYAARAVLIRHYAETDDVEGLKRCTHSGYGSMALNSLRVLHQRLRGGARVFELDVSGEPATP